MLVAAAAAVGVLLLPGCGGETIEPTTLNGSTEDSSKTPDDRPSPTPEVDQPTEAEARALVRKFIQARNAANEGETDALLSLCTKDSERCQKVAKWAEDTHRNGGSFIGDPSMRLLEFASKPEGTDPVHMSAYIEFDTYKWVSEKGAKPETVKGGVFLYEFELVREGEEWKVQEFFYDDGS